MPDASEDRPILGGGERLAREAQRISGGGPKYEPRTYSDARDLLLPMIEETLAAATRLPDRLRGERFYIEATLVPNYLAASHHPVSLEEDADLVVVGTRPAKGTLSRPRSTETDTPTKRLIFAATEASLGRIEELLREPTPTSRAASDLVKFDSIELPSPARALINVDQLDEAAAPVWEVVLQPAVDVQGRPSERVQDLIYERWNALVTSLGGNIHSAFVRRVGDLTFMPVQLPQEQLESAAAFNPLRSLKPMPRLRPIRPRFRALDLGDAVPPPPVGGPEADVRIAVFDGGVDSTHPLLSRYVTENDLTDLPAEDDGVSHGTLVTSALLYGHIQPGRPLQPPPAHVDMFRIDPIPWTVPAEDEVYWVADRVDEVLRQAPTRWKLVSLSYGPDVPVDDEGEVDRFTATMDRLVHEVGVPIIVAAGNDGNEVISSLGEDRVQAPADGVNVVGVGACHDIHPPEPTRASYSCVGPGRPGLRVQPLGVSFGGSENQLFIGADRSGGFQGDMGTSFAAPTTARGLATLVGAIPFSVNLARAFAAHFAVSPRARDLCAVGYGRFLDDYSTALSCGDGEISMVVDDEIARGETRAYPLPFPSGGLPSGKVRARWTVSFTSPTDPADPVEYTTAGLEVAFRPNAALFSISPPRGSGGSARDIDLRVDGTVMQTLMQQNWQLSTNPKTRPGSAIRSEQTLRDEGKWETVVRHEDGMRAKTLHLPEVWLTYFERDRGQLVPQQSARRLRFVLVMTVSAPSAPDLYEQVLADPRFNVLAPLRSLTAIQAPVRP